MHKKTSSITVERQQRELYGRPSFTDVFEAIKKYIKIKTIKKTVIIAVFLGVCFVWRGHVWTRLLGAKHVTKL